MKNYIPDINNSTSNPEVITKPKIEIASAILNELETFAQSEGQVIVHCLLYSTRSIGAKIRIWPSTFLFDNHSPHKSNLVTAENISLYPIWQEVPPGKVAHFTLVFNALPKACNSFDLIELIPELNGFTAFEIERNSTDVYLSLIHI